MNDTTAKPCQFCGYPHRASICHMCKLPALPRLSDHQRAVVQMARAFGNAIVFQGGSGPTDARGAMQFCWQPIGMRPGDAGSSLIVPCTVGTLRSLVDAGVMTAADPDPVGNYSRRYELNLHWRK